MIILIYGMTLMPLSMPWNFFFNMEMKYLTATPSGENAGVPIA